MTDINFMQAGEIVACGHCQPDKGFDLPERYGVPCGCRCHSPQPSKEESKLTEIKGKLDPETDYVLEAFFNDVVEATLRYVKGKNYGQDPTEYFKEQLGHWEGNLARHIANIQAQERERVVGEVRDAIKEMAVSANCKTCGSKTPAMFKMNDGLYCEEHAQGAYLTQQSHLGIEALRDRLQSFGSRYLDHHA